MTLPVDELFQRAAALPDLEREQLAQRLFASLTEDDAADWDPEYIREIERRMDDDRAGRVTTYDWEEVRTLTRRQR